MIELDEEQMEVVGSKESMVCIAGPGSGKTRVLTSKAQSLFAEGKNILCLTFTRSAAKEMQSRVPGLPATTIHSYCCGAVGWKVPPGEFPDTGYSYLLQRFIWEQRRDGRRFDWVLVDECQDLNPKELDVALSLVGDKLFAVGDPHQSIYGFQGAMGPAVVKWLKALGCREAVLHNNYRSCPNIVDRLNRIFKRGLVSKSIKDTGLTAILCRRNDDIFEASTFLKRNEVPHRVRLSAEVSNNREYDVLEESNLRLMTVHCSKGHEFDRVLLYNWLPDEKGEEERILYVGMARASKKFIEVNNLEELLKEVK